MSKDLPSPVNWEDPPEPTQAENHEQDEHYSWRLVGKDLEVEDPEFVKMLAEKHEATNFVTRLTAFTEVIGSAKPDLAIRIWERFRTMVRTVNQSSRDDHASLQTYRKEAGDPRPDPYKAPSTEELGGDVKAMAILGRWKAAVTFRSTAMLIQTQATTPTAVLRQTRGLMVSYETDLDRRIQDRARTAVYAWLDQKQVKFKIDCLFVRQHGSKTLIRAIIRRPV